MMTPFATAAPDLTALGYSPLPLIGPYAPHGGKGLAPGEWKGGRWSGMPRWQRFRDTGPSSFELRLWMQYENANVGIVMGTPAGHAPDGTPLHVLGLDFDALDPDVLDALLRAAPASPMAKRGSKGETRLYRAPKTLKSRSYDGSDGERLLDVLTGFDTRQTVCPPSISPRTEKPYVWLRGPVAANDLPILTGEDMAVLEETLEGLGWSRTGRQAREMRPKPVDADPDDMWSEVKTVAMNRLADWVPDLDLYNLKRARQGYECVESWRASSTGRHLADRKQNLSIQPDGIKDWGSNNTYSAIDLVMAAKDCDQAEATDWLRVKLGLKDEGVVIALGESPAGDREEITPKCPPPLDLDPAGRGEEIDAAKGVAQTEPFAEELPDDLTRVPGLVGLLTDWIADSARKPQRAAALLAALQLVGTAAGRQYAGPTMTGTHLYGLFLAPSGAAKDHPLKCIGRVLHACGMGQHFGPSQFMSMSALIKRMGRQPLTLSCIDEFGSFLTRINGRRASPHEKAITGVLRTAWGSSFDTMAPPEWAGSVGEPIHSPALSIYGVSTHEEFFASLEGGDVWNGFLNRFLILSTQVRVSAREPTADKMDVPQEIIDKMSSIYAGGNPLVRATSHCAVPDPPLVRLAWQGGVGGAAHSLFTAYEQACLERERDAIFYTRSAEMAQRLATIRAVGVDPTDPRIGLDDLKWGISVADWSAEHMVMDARDYMSETQTQGDTQRVFRVIRDARRMVYRDLLRAMQHRLKARDLQDILKALEDAGQIVVEEGERPATGGHRLKYYRLP